MYNNELSSNLLNQQQGGKNLILWGCMPNDEKERPVPLFSFLADQQLHATSHIEQQVVMVIGPEGDFSQKEKESLRSFHTSNVVAVSLSRNRLRVETAALVFASTVALALRC